MARKAFCVHAHFYQPPREDPFTGIIPNEPGAAPFDNWNERIFQDCYQPNVKAGNFKSISLNLGPTLVDWMVRTHPETWKGLVKQLHLNNGDQPANIIAQPYHHTILPLASHQDKITQLRWGIQSYKKYFGQVPEGMWLPETAVDKPTLEVLADNGIKFTILAPWQAKCPELDPRHPYLVKLSEGKSITVFFYERELSTRVSFDSETTRNADRFVSKLLMGKYDDDKEGKDQIILLASDGELYGHHKPFREKFLAYLLEKSLPTCGIEVTYPAKWLSEHPASEYIKIYDRTSWSCEHGVERWKGPCGCSINGAWKADLSKALNAIADKLDSLYLQYCEEWVKDPWELRHDYILVLLGEVEFDGLLAKHSNGKLDKKVDDTIGLLLKSQLERQKVFASCAWFFEDFERIEPQNAVRYTAHAVWLTKQATGIDISGYASRWLKPVRSWKSGLRADAIFDAHFDRAEKFKL
jgi:alpha-amylase/alpha-mannosidase (GH57 family)